MTPTPSKAGKRARSPEIEPEVEVEVGDDVIAQHDGEVEEEQDRLIASSSKSKLTDEARKKRKTKMNTKTKTKTSGIIYISRLPPGMTPQKVRHLMARWGDVGKVYAQRKDAPTGYNPNAAAASQKKQKHASANFTEAWVEFLDKSVAKTVAGMLNAQVIGGKKGDRWRDDIWTMKYLSGFKWEMLGEQVAYERQAHQARLRTEIARSKTEQNEYLKNVELARVLDKRKAKKAATETGTETGKGDNEDTKGHSKGYRQRPAVEKSKTLQGVGMDSVLGNIFG